MPYVRKRRRPRHRRKYALLAVIVLLLIPVIGLAAIYTLNVSPRVLANHLAWRAQGHSGLITVPVGWAYSILMRADWGPPRNIINEYPTWVGAASTAESEGPASREPATRTAASPEMLRLAIAAAEPGDRIQLLPGQYRFSGEAIDIGREATADAPITVGAAEFGEVTLQFDMVEGFRVHAPHWHFENLIIEGVCSTDSDCEHAFHIVGNAGQTVVRNTLIQDFNAHFKINGQDGMFPDAGVIEGSTLVNRHARDTENPVTPIDLVGASHWIFRGNLIADFVKRGGDLTSYGAFAKGAGTGNRFEGNVVLCEYRLKGLPGLRVGLSLGGGGSEPYACRDKRCDVEQEEGVLRNNLIAFCSDDGIYLNRAARSIVEHNTIINTAGITARWPETGANLAGNLLDGTTRVADLATIHDDGNYNSSRLAAYFGWHPVRSLFQDIVNLDLRWADTPPAGAPTNATGPDLCGAPRPQPPAFGAFENFDACRSQGEEARGR